MGVQVRAQNKDTHGRLQAQPTKVQRDNPRKHPHGSYRDVGSGAQPPEESRKSVPQLLGSVSACRAQRPLPVRGKRRRRPRVGAHPGAHAVQHSVAEASHWQGVAARKTHQVKGGTRQIHQVRHRGPRLHRMRKPERSGGGTSRWHVQDGRPRFRPPSSSGPPAARARDVRPPRRRRLRHALPPLGQHPRHVHDDRRESRRDDSRG
mmetsp:Transcript_14551/g.28670  ORF Transcript_14551/g.28670 Transcript_14551/m.28670 type:complete len:206 (+) Transcript_14551:1610-2227(+)